MMNPRSFLVVTTWLFCSHCFGQINVPTTHFEDLLSQRKYATLFNEAKYLREQKHGKCALVDYYIGRSICGSGARALAHVWYSNLLKNYKGITAPQTKIIVDAQKNCVAGKSNESGTTQLTERLLSAYITAVNAEGPHSGVGGALGLTNDSCMKAPLPVTVLREVSVKEMESRLFNINEGQAAVAKYRTLLANSNYKVHIRGRFIVISYGSVTDFDIEDLCKDLEIVYQFFISTFGLRAPDKLITAFLLTEGVDSKGSNILQQTAELIHGIKIPNENIGYSNVRDLSLLVMGDAVDAEDVAGGEVDDPELLILASRVPRFIMYHELMHLLIRTDIGDVPPWMDEGLACIYETSSIQQDNTLHGAIQNWRTSILEKESRKKHRYIPHLRDFLNYSWSKFDGIEDGDICQTSINYAYAKHLLLYLQQEHKLNEVFSGLKNRAVLTSATDIVLKTDVQILEEVLDTNIDEIERRFDAWMQATYEFSLYHPDASLNAETFLEIWDRYSQKIVNGTTTETDETRKKSWTAMVQKMTSLKTRYEKQLPTDHNWLDDVVEQTDKDVIHYRVAKREKKMPEIIGLKKELQEIIKLYNLLSQQ